ncbi:hypothetical protein L915_21435 [Phytophthora nicotianae]|uniref:Uncharacterized protein n=1 Tax=Phytophthora nicotianae TaxID=4792 RepID=W2FMY9_PHYNI|nr:hypothetical protein L915_21435 [Phytophthora nicotianae]
MHFPDLGHCTIKHNITFARRILPEQLGDESNNIVSHRTGDVRMC